MAAKKAIEDLGDREFVVAVLRSIAGHEGEESVIRLKALDRLAVVTGVYTAGAENVG